MASEEGGEGSKAAGDRTVGWREMVEDQWRRTKEHAEAYPYVWGSYILVYGGLGVYLTYRWRKLRRTEDRVRILQERLRKLVEAEESAAPPPPLKSQPPLEKSAGH
ncbi:uncharacterized protein [Typha angustifolia]|uniref:uncharacterized protein n=1 Tax=Typha angustifolia TaxID=59011 RepID=UPI003C2DB9C0